MGGGLTTARVKMCSGRRGSEGKNTQIEDTKGGGFLLEAHQRTTIVVRQVMGRG